MLAGSQNHRPKTKPIQQNDLQGYRRTANGSQGKGLRLLGEKLQQQAICQVHSFSDGELSFHRRSAARCRRSLHKSGCFNRRTKKVETQLIDQVRVYLSAVSTYKKYKASGWSHAFFAEHESEIRQYKQARYRQVLCANSFTSLAELSLHRAGKPALNYLVAEDRERVKGGEAACEALDVSSVFCYQPAMSSCISRCFMFMYFLPPHWVPAT